MSKYRPNLRIILLLLPLWLPGFIAAVWRCSSRIVSENRDKYVETVMDFEELRLLAREEGWSIGEMLDEVKKRGASSVGLSEDTLSTLQSEGRISLLTFQDVQKLSLEAFVATPTPPMPEPPGTLWVHSTDEALLDRIEQHLTWKVPATRLLKRLHRNMLLVRKSSIDFQERVGLGFSREYLRLAAAKGLGVVLRLFNYPGLSEESVGRIINDLPDPASVSALIFAEEEILGNRGALVAAVREFYDRGFRVGWVEFNDQDGMELLLARLEGKRPIVRVHSISRREIDELYTTSRAVARFVRAVRDRRLKMLYIRCFFQDKKKLIGDLVQFNANYLSEIVKSLESWGFEIPHSDQERRLEPRHLVGFLSAGERLAIGLALLLGIPFLIGLTREKNLPARDIFLTAGVAGIGIVFLSPDNFTALAGVSGAISYCVLGPIWAISRLHAEPESSSLVGQYGSGARFFLRLAIPGFIGGTLIAGLHAEVPYLLKFVQFRGVKAAFLVPLVIILYWTLRRFGGGILSFFARPLTIREGAIIAFALGGTLIYLLRSGNVTFLKPSEFEDLVRTFLENVLVARPRNKEFLIGYPAAVFFLFFYFRKAWKILPVLGLFVVMGQVSVVNTFCHFHSPLLLAYFRGFNGLWLGVVVGIGALAGYVILSVASALGRKERKVFLVGYFGFGNLGDEILWRSFITEGARVRPDLSWVVLHRTGMADDLPPNTVLVARHSVVGVLENLASARSVAVPGGGVLQACTSLLSLLYYFGLLIFGNLGGARLLLPAQGLGPLCLPAVEGSILGIFPGFFAEMLVRILVDNSDYLTVRDRASLDQVSRLPGPPRVAPLTADLAFLLDGPEKIRMPGERLRLGVILRGSIPEAASIARKLIELTERLENLSLNPIAFQPVEDESPWVGNPWADSIKVVRDVREAMEIFSGMDAVLSMRLHACLLATIIGVPWIGIDIDPKIKGFSQDCGWDFLLTPAQASDAEALTECLNKLMNDPAEKQERLKAFALARKRQAIDDVMACLNRIPRPR